MEHFFEIIVFEYLNAGQNFVWLSKCLKMGNIIIIDEQTSVHRPIKCTASTNLGCWPSGF